MNKIVTVLIILSLLGCEQSKKAKFSDHPESNTATDSIPTPELTLRQANNLAQLPLNCVDQEYPNKMGHVTAAPADQKRPRIQHPAFYGCFDWHSAVHGHWSAVVLLKQFPQLEKRIELLQ
jgi:hypothetical protein